MTPLNQRRGAMLMRVMLLVLVFLGLSVGALSEARSQGMSHAGSKLNPFTVSAANAPREEVCPVLGVYDTSRNPSLHSGLDPEPLRFNRVMKAGNPNDPHSTNDPEGDVLFAQGDTDLGVRFPAPVDHMDPKNHPDDPAPALRGFAIAPGQTIDPSWDFDGRVILSSAALNRGDATHPLAIQSEPFNVSGVNFADRHSDARQDAGSMSEHIADRKSAARFLPDHLI